MENESLGVRSCKSKLGHENEEVRNANREVDNGKWKFGGGKSKQSRNREIEMGKKIMRNGKIDK